MSFEKMPVDVKTQFDRCVSYISRIKGVLQIYLFGSYAYGEPTEYSDLDLYVVIEDGLDPLKVMIEASRGSDDRAMPIDILADTVGNFNERAEHFTLQREVRDKGVLVYGE